MKSRGGKGDVRVCVCVFGVGVGGTRWRAEGVLCCSFCVIGSVARAWMQHTELHYWSAGAICVTGCRRCVWEHVFVCVLHLWRDARLNLCACARSWEYAHKCVSTCVCVSSLRSATWAHTLTVTYLLQRRGSNPRYRAPHRVIAFFFSSPLHHVSSLFLTAHMQEVTSICESVSACIWINKSVCLTVSMCLCMDMRPGTSLCLEGYYNALRFSLLLC